jgi:hypothetical protein
MSALGFAMVGTGCILVWSGIRNENAVQLVLDVLSGGRKLQGAAGKAKAAATDHGATAGGKPGAGGTSTPGALGTLYPA